MTTRCPVLVTPTPEPDAQEMALAVRAQEVLDKMRPTMNGRASFTVMSLHIVMEALRTERREAYGRGAADAATVAEGMDETGVAYAIRRALPAPAALEEK